MPEIPDHLSNYAKSFIKQCLPWDPSLRSSASKLLDHPFVRDQATSRGANVTLTKEAFPFTFDGSRTPMASEMHSNRTNMSSFEGPVATSYRGAMLSPRREREFKVINKFAARKDLHHLRQFLAGRQNDSPQETIQALDVVLREPASKNREIVGRSLFTPDFGKGVLEDGVEYRKGFYQSLRPTQMGLSLNIDMFARAFYEPRLVSDIIVEFLGQDISRPLSDQERLKVRKALRNVRVKVRREDYMRRYKVRGLTAQPLNQLTLKVGIKKKRAEDRKEHDRLHLVHAPGAKEQVPLVIPHLDVLKVKDQRE